MDNSSQQERAAAESVRNLQESINVVTRQELQQQPCSSSEMFASERRLQQQPCSLSEMFASEQQRSRQAGSASTLQNDESPFGIFFSFIRYIHV